MMKIDVKPETYYQKRAASIIDIMFNGGLFNENITRKQMQIIEDFFACELQVEAESAAKLTDTMAKYKMGAK